MPFTWESCVNVRFWYKADRLTELKVPYERKADVDESAQRHQVQLLALSSSRVVFILVLLETSTYSHLLEVSSNRHKRVLQ